jgi:hypothetical protein
VAMRFHRGSKEKPVDSTPPPLAVQQKQVSPRRLGARAAPYPLHSHVNPPFPLLASLFPVCGTWPFADGQRMPISTFSQCWACLAHAVGRSNASTIWEGQRGWAYCLFHIHCSREGPGADNSRWENGSAISPARVSFFPCPSSCRWLITSTEYPKSVTFVALSFDAHDFTSPRSFYPRRIHYIHL